MDDEEEEWVEYDGDVVQDRHNRASRIRMASDVTSIPADAFVHCDLMELDLNNVTIIPEEAFFNCYSLERVVHSAVEIGSYAFAECIHLWEIDLSNVTKIGERAFEECRGLKHVSIPSSVATIEDSSFHSCTRLVVVDLGEGLQRIGTEAFRGCYNLRRINVPASVTDIEDDAFHGCDGLKEVQLNEGLQHIGERAFQDCTSLVGINIPSSVTFVDNDAFRNCTSLSEVTLREGIHDIGAGAFDDCTSLEHIAIPVVAYVIDVWGTDLAGEEPLQELDVGVPRINTKDCDHKGRCVHHPHVKLRKKKFFRRGWKVLMSACPDCCDEDNMRRVVAKKETNAQKEAERRVRSCQLMRTTMPVPQERALALSEWVRYRSIDQQLEQAEAIANEILARHQQTDDEIIQCIRDESAYYNLVDVTTMLELAIWSVNMNGNGEDAEVRQRSRKNCGSDMNVIIPGVLEYFLEE